MTNPYRTEQPVAVIDDFTVKPGQQRALLELLTGPYAELAQQRQLILKNTFALPPMERPGESTQLLVIWEYPSLDALWQARGPESMEPQIAELWRQIDTLCVRHQRRLGRAEPMANCERADFTAPPIAELPGTLRRILFIQPATELDSAAQQRWVEAAIAVPGALRSNAGFHEGYSFLPGQMTWDITAPAALTLDQLLAALPGPANLTDAVELGETLSSGIREPGIAGTKRTILLQSLPNLDAAGLEEMEHVIKETPFFLTDLLNWRFSRIASSHGEVAWTHCIEQEVIDSKVFLTNYLNHPYHWAIIDRFFHPEAHEVAGGAFCHTLYPIKYSALAGLND